MSKVIKKTFWPVVAASLMPGPAQACATCFGDPNSSLTRGMNAGVIFLLIVVFAVLALISSFVYYLVKKSKLMMFSRPEEMGIRRLGDARS